MPESDRPGRPKVRRLLGGILVDIGPLRRHRDFRRLWAGQLVSQLGSQLTIVAVSYQTYRLTGSTAMVGLVSLGQLVPLLAGSLLGGPLVDAWDRRRVMLFTQLMLAAGSAGLAANALAGHPLLWPVFACTAEAAAFQGLDWSARRASLRRLVPPPDLPAALSVQSAAFQLTTVLGPAAAGLLIAQAGFGLVYGLDVASFAVAFGSVLLLPRLPPDRGGQPASLASLIGGVRYLRASQPLAGVFLIDLGAMVFGLPRALFPALAGHRVRRRRRDRRLPERGTRRRGAARLAAHRPGRPGAPAWAGRWSSASRCGAWPSPASAWSAGCPRRWCCWPPRVRPTSSRPYSGW